MGAPRGVYYRGLVYLILGDSAPGDEDLGSADAQYTGEEIDDAAGTSVTGAGDVDGDGYADLLVGAPGVATKTGAAYLVLGGSAPGDLDLGSADAQYTGEEIGDYAGNSVAGAGDVDGDGSPDLLIGAYINDDGGSGAGAAYLVLGDSAPGDLDLGSADAQYTGEQAGDGAGSSVAGAGDVDGDGYADLLMGARYNHDGGDYAGAAYLVLGGSAPGDLDLGSADAQYTGELGDYAGTSVAGAGDIDGDDHADLLIGAYLQPTWCSGTPRPAAWTWAARTRSTPGRRRRTTRASRSPGPETSTATGICSSVPTKTTAAATTRARPTWCSASASDRRRHRSPDVERCLRPYRGSQNAKKSSGEAPSSTSNFAFCEVVSQRPARQHGPRRSYSPSA